MLIKQATLDAIQRGDVSCVIRRWQQPRVRPGSTMRTSVGTLVVDNVAEVRPDDVNDEDVRAAGVPDRASLLASLGGSDRDSLYRISLHYAGPDPRVGLRERLPSPSELDELASRLQRMDRTKGTERPWTADILRIIGDRPGTRAAALASDLSFEVSWFKRNVRKLKELGLTESLGTGYRLSPRGRAVLAAVARRTAE